MNLNEPIKTSALTNTELSVLRKGNFQTVENILLATTQDIAKRCRSSPMEIKRIVDKLLDATPLPPLKRLDAFDANDDELFTTGDEILDASLGGGLRTGLIWEIVGESAAGKTQLALQLSLFVQVPTNLRGLSGATCYLTTSSSLPTERLLQIAESNGLSLPGGGLEHVHTIPAPTVAVLLRILEDTLPSFIEKNASRPGDKKVKLLVIDALGELFHLNDKTTMNTLVQRSKDITTISARLHELASKHELAVLVLNEVIDVFDRPLRADGQGDLLYETQSRWFSSAWAFGDGKKEASLGLVWANQLNVRIMLSRTGRRRYLNEEDLPKRQRQPIVNSSTRQALEESRQQEPALIRRLGVIFSSVSSPIALDYIVTESGISILQEAGVNPPSKAGITSAPSPGVIETSNPAVDEDPGASAPESTEALPNSRTKQANHLAAGDEFDDLLTQDDSYDNVDWDTLELNLSQAHV